MIHVLFRKKINSYHFILLVNKLYINTETRFVLFILCIIAKFVLNCCYSDCETSETIYAFNVHAFVIRENDNLLLLFNLTTYLQ